MADTQITLGMASVPIFAEWNGQRFEVGTIEIPLRVETGGPVKHDSGTWVRIDPRSEG